MSKKLFNVISPDGFPISCEPFASEREAVSAIPVWCERFKNQGHYSTSNRQKIPLTELPDYLRVVPADSEFSLCC
jgi:hypothetical protein